MNYAVIIVTYNRLQLLKECLEAVNKQVHEFNDVIIVNNNSTDGTLEFLEECKKKQDNIIIVDLDKNIGGAGGFEVGVDNVPNHTDYVLLIDDDAILEPDFLKVINENMVSGVEAYSGTIITNGHIDTSHRRRLTNPIFMTKSDVNINEYEKKVFSYDLATFCGFMISKRLIDTIGKPNGEYFIWYDDTEYSMRVRKYSEILNINKALINHKTITNNGNKLNWKSFYGYRNQIDLGKKYSKIPIIYCMYRYTYHLLRIIQFYIRSLLHKDKTYYMECAKLNKAVIKKSLLNKLGIDDDYYPGRTI